MKRERTSISETRLPHSSSGVLVHSGLRAGYTCPSGWWKYKKDKERMCCHWVWKPGTGYVVECTT